MMIRDLITISMDVFLLWQIESLLRRWALIYFSLQRIESFISQWSTAVKIRLFAFPTPTYLSIFSKAIPSLLFFPIIRHYETETSVNKKQQR